MSQVEQVGRKKKRPPLFLQQRKICGNCRRRCRRAEPTHSIFLRSWSFVSDGNDLELCRAWYRFLFNSWPFTEAGATFEKKFRFRSLLLRDLTALFSTFFLFFYFFYRKCKRHWAFEPCTPNIRDMKLTQKARKFVFGCHLRVRDQAGRRCQACAALCSSLHMQPRLQFVKQMKCEVASTSRFFGLQSSDPPDKSRRQNKPFGIGWENLMSFFFFFPKCTTLKMRSSGQHTNACSLQGWQRLKAKQRGFPTLRRVAKKCCNNKETVCQTQIPWFMC